MAYRHDPDLEFLKDCSAEELDGLVKTLTHDEKEKKRWTESLSSKDSYKKHYPNHSMYWEDIAEELQRFGGNTISNLARNGKGVLYREILLDVCHKLKIKPQHNFPFGVGGFLANKLINKKPDFSNYSIQEIELLFLQDILGKLVEKLAKEDPDTVKKIAEKLAVSDANKLPPAALSTATITALQGLLSMQIPVAVNLIMDILGTVVAKEAVKLPIAAIIGTNGIGKLLVRFSHPVMLAISSAWLISDIAAPAMRVTVPATVQVAILRMVKTTENSGQNEA